ncbi:hypothetical protein EDD11_009644, partial [Mortierella claussenii]
MDQDLIIGEAKAVAVRMGKGKAAPGLDTPECHCLFYRRYLLPCRHILHEQMYGERPGELLKDDDWKAFRRMFEETGLEIYRSRELIE